MHSYNQNDKCVYCGSTRQMIDKFKWKCSNNKEVLDRIVNEDVYTAQRVKDGIKRLKESKDPWDNIIYIVNYTDDGIKGLSIPQLDIFCLNLLLGETRNGGIEQYFSNSSGETCCFCLKSLNKYRLNDISDGLKSVINDFVNYNDDTTADEIKNAIYNFREINEDKYWDYWNSDKVVKLEKSIENISDIVIKLIAQQGDAPET